MWTTYCQKLNIDEEISKVMNEVFKFDKITKVQNIVINEFIKNQDVIVKSITGSGKTLSYLIPLFQRLIAYSKTNENYKNSILSLILLPSRELSTQVYSNVMEFINNMEYKFTAQLLIGGKKVENDLQKINENVPNIIIATPGRFLDITEQKNLNFSDLVLLVLDEADKMLDMGFEVALSQILSKLPKQRRTGLFSATVTSNVENIIKAGMRNPVYIDIRNNYSDEKNLFITEKELNSKIKKYGDYYKIIPFSCDNEKINNTIEEVPQGLLQYYREIKNIKYKISHLVQILNALYNSDNNKKIMIFVGTCTSANYYFELFKLLFQKISMPNCGLYKLHSNMAQNKREKEFQSFRDDNKHKLSILFSTDLAARGVDVPNIDMIIQFDPPKKEESYIHKVGRTARVGHSGVSLLFITQEENTFITYMKNKGIKIENFPPLSEVEDDIDKLNNVSILGLIKSINLSDKWIYDKAVNSFISFLKFYKEIELKYIFNFKSLDIGNLANSFQLVKFPTIKMKEFLSDSIKNFTPDLTVMPKDLEYKNKNIEKQMNEKRERHLEKVRQNIEKKEQNKINYVTSRKEEKKHNRSRKEKKEAKLKSIIEEWDDLADDDKLYKKYKKGKISKEEYDKFLLKLK